MADGSYERAPALRAWLSMRASPLRADALSAWISLGEGTPGR
jgi:hypothetical protein